MVFGWIAEVCGLEGWDSQYVVATGGTSWVVTWGDGNSGVIQVWKFCCFCVCGGSGSC